MSLTFRTSFPVHYLGFCREIPCSVASPQLLEPVETIPAIAHQLAGLGDIPELLGQFQNAHFRLDDLLLDGHRPHSFR
jgi:hypothetical protein